MTMVQARYTKYLDEKTKQLSEENKVLKIQKLVPKGNLPNVTKLNINNKRSIDNITPNTPKVIKEAKLYCKICDFNSTHITNDCKKLSKLILDKTNKPVVQKINKDIKIEKPIKLDNKVSKDTKIKSKPKANNIKIEDYCTYCLKYGQSERIFKSHNFRGCSRRPPNLSRKAFKSILANKDNPPNTEKGTEANASSPDFEEDSSDSAVSMQASDDDEDEDQNESQPEWPSSPNHKYLFKRNLFKNIYHSNDNNLFKNKIYINLSKVVKDNTNILKSNINLNKIDLQNNFSLINNSNRISSCTYCTKYIYKHFDAILDSGANRHIFSNFNYLSNCKKARNKLHLADENINIKSYGSGDYGPLRNCLVAPSVTTPLISGPLLATENKLLMLIDGIKMYIFRKQDEPGNQTSITATLSYDNLYHVDDMTKFISMNNENDMCKCKGKPTISKMVIPTLDIEAIPINHSTTPEASIFREEEANRMKKAKGLNKLKQQLRTEIKHDALTHEIEKTQRRGSAREQIYYNNFILSKQLTRIIKIKSIYTFILVI